MFQIICDFENKVPNDKFRDVIFEATVENDIHNRFDTSHKYWVRFKARNIELEKIDYFEIESIDNPCQVVIAVNLREHYEHFENFSSNKRRKAQKKGTPGMNFENFAKRIVTANQIENLTLPKTSSANNSNFLLSLAKYKELL